MTTTSERLAEVPSAIVDWAAGAAEVIAENAPRVAVFVIAVLGVGLVPFGAGLLAVLLAVVLPAGVVGAIVLLREKVVPLVRERLGSSRPRPFGEQSESVVERRPSSP